MIVEKTVLDQLRRYSGLVDDWKQFESCVQSPQPQAIWMNPLRIGEAEFLRILAEEALPIEKLAWREHAYRLPRQAGLGALWWYRVGLAHSQDESSQLAATVLNPGPGDSVLDLCAAPGGKTAQIAVALEGQGTVVANDLSGPRLRPLKETIERLALPNVSMTAVDGRRFSEGNYNKVLVDAPCTCEGTLRKNPLKLSAINTDARAHRANLQKALLSQAVSRCSPGGQILYSTCTFAPEENEAIVDAVLQQYGGDVQLQRIADLAGFEWQPGIDQWEGRSYDASLCLTRRVWPHANDSGGFFLALLHKAGGSKVREACTGTAIPESLQTLLNERFGVPGPLPYIVTRSSANGMHCAANDHCSPHNPVASGLRIYRHKGKPPALTSYGARLFARQASRHCIDLTAQQLTPYLQRAELTLSAAQLSGCSENGFVIVRFRGAGLGTAVVDLVGKRMKSLYPKN